MRATQPYLRHMEPEHLLSLPGGALLLSRSGTGATLRLHLSDQGPDVFTLRRRSRATLRLGSRAEFEGRGGLDCGRSAPPSGEGSTKPALASPHRNRSRVGATSSLPLQWTPRAWACRRASTPCPGSPFRRRSKSGAEAWPRHRRSGSLAPPREAPAPCSSIAGRLRPSRTPAPHPFWTISSETNPSSGRSSQNPQPSPAGGATPPRPQRNAAAADLCGRGSQAFANTKNRRKSSWPRGGRTSVGDGPGKNRTCARGFEVRRSIH